MISVTTLFISIWIILFYTALHPIACDVPAIKRGVSPGFMPPTNLFLSAYSRKWVAGFSLCFSFISVVRSSNMSPAPSAVKYSQICGHSQMWALTNKKLASEVARALVGAWQFMLQWFHRLLRWHRRHYRQPCCWGDNYLPVMSLLMMIVAIIIDDPVTLSPIGLGGSKIQKIVLMTAMMLLMILLCPPNYCFSNTS